MNNLDKPEDHFWLPEREEEEDFDPLFVDREAYWEWLMKLDRELERICPLE